MLCTCYIHAKRCYIFIIWFDTMVYYNNIAGIHRWRWVGIAFTLPSYQVSISLVQKIIAILPSRKFRPSHFKLLSLARNNFISQLFSVLRYLLLHGEVAVKHISNVSDRLHTPNAKGSNLVVYTVKQHIFVRVLISQICESRVLCKN